MTARRAAALDDLRTGENGDPAGQAEVQLHPAADGGATIGAAGGAILGALGGAPAIGAAAGGAAGAAVGGLTSPEQINAGKAPCD